MVLIFIIKNKLSFSSVTFDRFLASQIFFYILLKSVASQINIKICKQQKKEYMHEATYKKSKKG